MTFVTIVTILMKLRRTTHTICVDMSELYVLHFTTISQWSRNDIIVFKSTSNTNIDTLSTLTSTRYLSLLQQTTNGTHDVDIDGYVADVADDNGQDDNHVDSIHKTRKTLSMRNDEVSLQRQQWQQQSQPSTTF